MFGWLKPRRQKRPVTRVPPARNRTPALEKLLTHPDADTRRQALARLEQAGYRVDKAPPAARAAYFVLKRQYDRAAAEGGHAVAPLVLDLDDPRPNPDAVGCLTAVGGPATVRGLEAILTDPRRAAGSLQLIAARLKALGWRPDTAEGRAATAAAAHEFEQAADEGEAALPFLLRALGGYPAWPDQPSRDAFFRAVVRFGAAAADGLRGAYFDPRPGFEPCREFVTACLARFPGRRATDALAEVVNSAAYRDWHLLRVLTRLTQAGDARAIPALVRRAADPDRGEGTTWVDLLRTLVRASHPAVATADLIAVVGLTAVRKSAAAVGTGDPAAAPDELEPLDCADIKFTALAELSRRRRTP